MVKRYKIVLAGDLGQKIFTLCIRDRPNLPLVYRTVYSSPANPSSLHTCKRLLIQTVHMMTLSALGSESELRCDACDDNPNLWIMISDKWLSDPKE